jgi:hypothetical protein
LNEKEKLIIKKLEERMATHPDEKMAYKDQSYAPAEMIEEIEKGTEIGKSVVKEVLNILWDNVLNEFPIKVERKKKTA